MEPSPAPDLSEWRKKRKQKESLSALPKRIATVIALDPGGTTGWSLFNVHPAALSDPTVSILDNIKLWQHGQIDCGSLKGNLGVSKHHGISTSGEAAGVSEIIGLIRAWPGAAVVIEDFIVRQFNQDRDFLAPVRITAAISQWMWQMRREYFVQQPSFAKTTVTDDRLKRWNLYARSGGMNHARDADRHAITFLRRCKAGEEFRQAAFPHLYSEGMPFATVDKEASNAS